MTGPTLFSPTGGINRAPPASVGANVPAAEKAKLRGKADEFETYFIQQFIDLSSPDASDNPLNGGGPTEAIYSQKMHEQMAKALVARGGIGLGQQVYGELLRMQDAKYATLPTPTPTEE